MKLLNAPEIVEVTGSDARAFIQAQFCNDVEPLHGGTSQMSAWLNAQGKVRALFHLYCLAADHYLLLLRGGKAVDVAQALVPFVFRSKLRIQPSFAWRLYGQSDDAALNTDDHAMVAASLRIPVPGSPRILYLSPGNPEPGLPTDPIDSSEWDLADVRDGVPSLPDTALAQFPPAWLDLERLAAISYRKGCYPGQEIVARMHFRGVGTPRRLGWVRYAANGTPPGDVVRDPLGAAFAWLLNRAPANNGSTEALAVLTAETGIDGARWRDQHGSELEVISIQWKR